MHPPPCNTSPNTMASTSSVGMPDRFKASLTAALPSSNASTSWSDPRRALAMAVRAAETMTASPMTTTPHPEAPSYPDVYVRLWAARLLTYLLVERALEVAHVVLGLLQQRAQRLGHAGQTELAGLLVALPVTVELALLELEIEL